MWKCDYWKEKSKQDEENEGYGSQNRKFVTKLQLTAKMPMSDKWLDN